MNPIRKFYCRAFQTVFKAAIPILPYRMPAILNSLSEVPGVLEEKEIDSVLIIADKTVEALGLTRPLKNALKEKNIRFCEYNDTVPNPTVENVEEALKLYLTYGCHALIGFGGGSAIDCAKAVGARVVRPRTSLNRMRGILKVLKRPPLTIAVPTTAGTGSETTVTTVITDKETGNKLPISDLVLIPHIAVLDPEVTKTLPPAVTATTGMDALTHAIEAFIGRSTVPSTRKDALEAARLVSENLLTAYQNGADLTARANMLRAAHLAGRAFSKSYVGYCHAVAHSLGGKYNIPHGLANAVILPYVLKAYGSTIDKKAKQLTDVMNLTNPKDSPKGAGAILAKYVEDMNWTMQIPTKLAGIQPEDIEHLSAHADHEANPLYPVPVLMDRQALTRFYYDVMEESQK